jgi:hypothetical protein
LQISHARTKKFDALNFLCAFPESIAGELPAHLRTAMRHALTHVADTAARVRPLIRLADRSCTPVMAWGVNFRPDTGRIRKART